MMNSNLQLMNQLQPIDVIVAKKRNGIGRILNHYMVYIGDGVFIGNLEGCVKEISHNDLLELLKKYEPTKIRKFTGNYIEIEQAKNRAFQRLGDKYSFIGFNCEHFANWVQHGKEKSSQVITGFLLLAGLVTLKLIKTSNGRR